MTLVEKIEEGNRRFARAAAWRVQLTLGQGTAGNQVDDLVRRLDELDAESRAELRAAAREARDAFERLVQAVDDYDAPRGFV